MISDELNPFFCGWWAMDIIKNNTKGDANPLYVYKRDQKRGKGEKKNPFFLKQNLLNCTNKIGAQL